MLVKTGTHLMLECCSLSEMLLDPLINQTLVLLLIKLLIVGPHICLVFIACIVLFSDRRRIMRQVSVTVVAVVPRHCDEQQSISNLNKLVPQPFDEHLD